MYAPKEIIDYLEPILSIYLSDFRHKERSAFILCDNLIELCCKKRIKERNSQDNQNRNRNFPDSLKDAKIPKKFRDKLLQRHAIRNDLQHEKLGLSIDSQDIACDILNVVYVIKKLWGRYALDEAPDWAICALRIVELYSSSSNHSTKTHFESKLLKEIDWTDNSFEEKSAKITMSKNNYSLKRLPRKNEIIIEVGKKNFWPFLVKEKTYWVNKCLDQVLNKTE